jgi:hypothetical protein
VRRRDHDKTLLGALRRFVVALAALGLLFVVVSGLAQANSRYFYCEAMGLRDTDPCADAARRREWREGFAGAGEADEARQGHGDCCRVLTLPAIPSGTATADPLATPSPHVAALAAATPSACVPSRPPAPARVRADRPHDRWRAPPGDARERRAQVMVFLT